MIRKDSRSLVRRGGLVMTIFCFTQGLFTTGKFQTNSSISNFAFVTHVTASCLPAAYTGSMLSEKQFRERARTELRQIGEQLKALATDRDVYWKLERDIVEPNSQLKHGRHAFLDMLRGCYVEAMTARVLRLLQPADEDASLPRILEHLRAYPDLMHDRLSQREFTDDRKALQSAVLNIRRTAVPRAAHHERTLSALASANRELDAALDLMIAQVKNYYWIITDSYIDLEVSHAGDPLSIFQFAWAVPLLAK